MFDLPLVDFGWWLRVILIGNVRHTEKHVLSFSAAKYVRRHPDTGLHLVLCSVDYSFIFSASYIGIRQ